MPIILKIESGPLANTSLPIKPTAPLRIGRTEQADLAISEDRFLSGVHFEVQYDGQTCRLRDLNSSNGTRLNGVTVLESDLKIGDEISAGQTLFSLRIEREQPIPDAPLDLPAEAHSRLLTNMREYLQPLYVVLDTAKEPSIFKLLLESRSEYTWLLEGEAICQIAHFAPYLVPLPPDSTLLPILIQNGWGKNWGVYLTSNAPPLELLAFLRRLLIAQLPDGSDAMLRFYDPRVLRTLLSNSTPSQHSYLFGPVRLYMMEAEAPDVALGFALRADGLIKTELPLSGSLPSKTTSIKSESEMPLIPGRAINDSINMLILHKKQLDLLNETKRNSLKDALIEDLRKQLPEKFAGAGEARMEALVQYGCTRPQRYGIRAHVDIRRYVDLMVKLGRHFDTDQQLPWASQILSRRMSPAKKLDKLEAMAKDQMNTPPDDHLTTGLIPKAH